MKVISQQIGGFFFLRNPPKYVTRKIITSRRELVAIRIPCIVHLIIRYFCFSLPISSKTRSEIAKTKQVITIKKKHFEVKYQSFGVGER
jgi:hypothetical protein